jgi:PAS domain S-box-containing protein
MEEKTDVSLKHHYELILDSLTEGVFTVDMNWRITSFNRAAERITGTQRVQAIGRYCFEIFRADVCETGCMLRRTLETGTSLSNKAVYV